VIVEVVFLLLIIAATGWVSGPGIRERSRQIDRAGKYLRETGGER
jgi:hypothetical protein